MTALDFSSHNLISDGQAGPGCAETEKAGFSGFMADINLSDLVQLACLENRERKLVIQSPGASGEIYFSAGDVVHARTGDKTGEEAFYEILCLNRGSFRFYTEQTTEHTIDVPWNFLLIESLRRKDEINSSLHAPEKKQPKVLVVDDSRFFISRLRDVLTDNLSAQVIAEARNGKEALEFLDQTRPDVITLDMNMPVMAGDIALKHIMIRSPAPVLLVSNFSERHTAKIMEYLRLGAVDFFAKPGADASWEFFMDRLGNAVGSVLDFKVKNIRRAKNPKKAGKKSLPGMPAEKLVVMLGGFGGLLEIQKIMPELCLEDSTSLVVLQQVCKHFCSALAGYLDEYCFFSVKALETGAPLLSNQAWISDLNTGWKVEADETGAGIYRDRTLNSLKADQFLKDLAAIFKRDLTVVLLSGIDLAMVEGLESVDAMGGRIIIQKPDTCLHPGPLMAIKALDLEERTVVSEEIAALLNKNRENA